MVETTSNISVAPSKEDQVHVLRRRFLEGIQEIFRRYQAPGQELLTFVGSVLLVPNSTTLLNGVYGTGKTQLVHLIQKAFFTPGTRMAADGMQRPESGEGFGVVTCTQDLTPLDALYHLDLAKLTQGVEEVCPRAIVTASFKFVNEAQRASALLYNGLLPLLAERRVVYRDQVFESPEHVCFMDANPMDVGSTEMPQAFRDRIDYSYYLPLVPGAQMVVVEEQAHSADTLGHGLLANQLEPVLGVEDMHVLWEAVGRVSLSREVQYLAALTASHLQRCVYVDRSRVASEFTLPCADCSFQAEPCAKIAEIPGVRFLLSTLRLARARAWLRGVQEVGVEDVLYGLPYTLAHRLRIKTDAARMYPNPAQWVREELYERSLRGRVPRWQQLVHHLLAGAPWDDSVLGELVERDLAAADFVRGITGKAFREVF